MKVAIIAEKMNTTRERRFFISFAKWQPLYPYQITKKVFYTSTILSSVNTHLITQEVHVLALLKEEGNSPFCWS